jgi:hypothetical protein
MIVYDKVYESVWKCMIKCMKVYDSVWKCMKVYESVWKCMKVYESVWKWIKVYPCINIFSFQLSHWRVNNSLWIAITMKGSYICSQCSKCLASSQSLWNHKQRCKGVAVRNKNVGESSCDDIPTFDGSEFLKENPKPETLARLEKFVNRRRSTNHPSFVDKYTNIRNNSGHDTGNMQVADCKKEISCSPYSNKKFPFYNPLLACYQYHDHYYS